LFLFEEGEAAQHPAVGGGVGCCSGAVGGGGGCAVAVGGHVVEVADGGVAVGVGAGLVAVADQGGQGAVEAAAPGGGTSRLRGSGVGDGLVDGVGEDPADEGGGVGVADQLAGEVG